MVVAPTRGIPVNQTGITQLARRVKGWRAAAALFGLAAGVALALLLAIVGDAAFDLHENTRAAVPWALLICAAAFLIAAAIAWKRLDDLSVAKLFERQHPELSNRLTNAVQLEQRAGEGAVQEFFRERAVQLGREAAAPLRARSAASAWIRGASIALAGAVIGWLVMLVLAGNVVRTVWPRLRDPHGDHPPFSRLQIEVKPGSANVLYGSQLEVRATAKGAPTEKLWVVSESGTNRTQTMMFLAPDRSFFQTLANVREPAKYYITDGKARSKRFPISVRYTPQISLVELTTTFPEYTSRAARTAKLDAETAPLPEDTRVQFKVVSNRPLKTGSLEITPLLGGKKLSVPLQRDAQQENTVRGEFTLREAVAFNLNVTDTDGLTSAEPRQGRFAIAPDQRPRLTIMEPARDAVATPTFKVPVRVVAEDDYAVSRVAWLRSHNRSTERPAKMPLTMRSGPQSVEATGEFDLGALGVKPGDVIEYYFEGADNYPHGPNVALSRMYRLEIISEAAYEKILQQMAARKGLFENYAKLGAFLRRLAENARSLEEKARKGEPVDKGAADLAKNMEKFQRELQKSLNQKGMFDVEKSFRGTLNDEQQPLANALKKLKEGIASGQLGEKELKEIAKELTDLAGENKEDVSQPAAQIADVARVLSKADRFVKLAAEEARIARMLERFWSNTNELTRIEQMEVRQLAEEQKKVQEEVRDLISTLPSIAATLGEFPQYDQIRKDVDEFIQAVAEAKIEKSLAEASELLANQEAAAGYFVAKTTAEKMDELISKCESKLQASAKQCFRFKPKIQREFGRTLDQIMAALGASGDGGQGSDGYSLFSNDLALYGPDSQMDRGDGEGMDSGGSGSREGSLVAAREETPDKPTAAPAGKVRLQPNAKFPMRYRELVGDYFRAIAESEGDSK
jgi:hypothetical protein